MFDQKVAVVLVTFNRLDKLKIALKCYESQTFKPTRIIVVDNCSNDGTQEYLKDWKTNTSLSSELVFLNENTGGAGGFGTGMDYALKEIKESKLDADWILVSDDDAFPKDDAIEKMIEFYSCLNKNEQDNIVALSSTVLNHGEIHEGHRSRVNKNLFRVRFVPVSKDEYVNKSFEIDLFSYVGTMIKVDALLSCGTTNKELFIYGDDNEHSLRLRKLGKVICVTDSIYNHDTPGIDSRKIGWPSYYNRRNQLYILKKYFPRRCFYTRYIKRYLFDISVFSKHSKEEKKLFKTAHHDAIKGKLGKHPIYKPGFTIKES